MSSFLLNPKTFSTNAVWRALTFNLVLLIFCFPSPSTAATTTAVPPETPTPAPPAVEKDPGVQNGDLLKETKAVALRGDDERLRPESQFQTTIGNTLMTFTGAFSIDFNLQDNLDLDNTKERDRFRWSPELELNFIFAFPKGFYLFSEFSLEDELTFQDKDQPMNSFEFQASEFFLQTPLPLPIPSAMRIGRQQFFEPRRWVLNETLDGFRLLLDPEPFHIRLSVSTPVPSNDDNIRVFDDIFENRDQIDFLAQTTFDIPPLRQKSKAGMYVLIRDDDSSTNEDPIWIGLRTFGRPKFKWNLSENPFLKNLLKPRIKYWVDAAFVAGTINNRTIRGYGFDVGASYVARKLPFRPYATLGYAYGSGDSNPKNGKDGNFRQTGFQSNSGKFGGVVNFDYYGILFDPELSNMHIYTAGLGFRPLERTSVDIVYHHYTQASRADNLRNIDIKADLTGRDKNLGDEIDLIVGIRAIQNMRFRLRTGYFIPGKAFVDDDPAFEGRLDVQFSF